MPGHLVHAYIDRLNFGRVYWKVHRRMDSAWLVLRRNHRVLWHDWPSAYCIACDAYPNDENAVWSAWLHIRIDEQCTADPQFRRNLEMQARADAAKRKKRKKSSKKKEELLFPELDALLNDLKKMAEIKRMAKALRA